MNEKDFSAYYFNDDVSYLNPIQIERTGCPCTLVEPCMRSCTCGHPVKSGGCKRCVRYGSLEQQLKTAKKIIRDEKELQVLRDQKWRDEYLETKGLH